MNPISETADDVAELEAPPVLSEEDSYRAAAYNLLANLLRRPPNAVTLAQLGQMDEAPSGADELYMAFSMLGLAARSSEVEQLDDEYHSLFIGIGRGELVPYGSWYQTGFLMEKPLSVLRDDLTTLGFERQSDVKEPEDHICALCEVMALLIGEGRDLDTQQGFHQAHLAPWVAQFFTDLSQAKSAVFYRAVGRLGSAFAELETHYLRG